MINRLRPEDVSRLLAATAMFGALDLETLTNIAAATLQRTYRRDQYLCYQGDPGDRLFIIASGLVKVVYTSPQGDEMVLATLRSPEIFGELAVLDQVPRSASVIAVEPTLVLMLSSRQMRQAMHNSPELVDEVLAIMSGLIRRLTEQTADFAFLDLGGRLAKLLLRLVEENELTGSNIVLDLPFTQSELAAMIGASRPAVNRVLHSFACRGLLKVNGNVIVLHDLAGLRQRAGF